MTGVFRAPWRSWPRALWWLILVAFLLRAAALAATTSIRCLADECFYTNLAGGLAEGAGFLPHARHYWPPGYIFFLAAHFKLGLTVLGAKIVQLPLSTLLVPLVYALGQRAGAARGETFARRTGLVAAALITFNPTLVAYSHYLWTETLFLPLFVGGFLLTLAAAEDGSRWRAAGAGVLFGLACLVKVLPFYLVPLLAIWMIVRATEVRTRVATAAILVLTTLGVVAPWTIRNAVVHQRFVLIETTLGKNLVRGNNPIGPCNWDWGLLRQTRGLVARAGCNESNPFDQNACLTRTGFGGIVSEPIRFIRQGGTKIADMANPTSFLVRHIRRNIYGNWPLLLAHVVVGLVAAYNMAMMGLGAVGWLHGPPGPARSVTVLLIIYTLAVHLLTFAMSRFRMPLEPFLAVGAGLLLAAPATMLTDAWRSRHRWLTLGVLAGLVLCWSLRVEALYYRPGVSADATAMGPADGD